MDSNNLQKQDVPGLYALKALCALFVVIIHIPLAGKDYMSPVIRVAVPCFYMISGFFLYSGILQKEITKAWKWTRKAFVLALAVNLFYCLFRAISSEISIIVFIISFITGDSISGHLWYLTALWQGLLLFIIIRRYLPACLISFLPLLCFVNLFFGRYYFLFDSGEYSLPQYVRLNCIAVALPYICLGYTIKKYIGVFLAMKGWIIFLFLSVLFIYTEEYILDLFFVNNTVSYSLFTLPLALCCLLVCLKDMKSVPLFVINIGKRHSANIYYFHPFMGAVVSVIFGSRFLNIDPSSIKAIVVFVLCLIFSSVLLFVFSVLGNLVKDRIKVFR